MILFRNVSLESKAATSIEIGCAYGISSIFICLALSEINGSNFSHTILDPYQYRDDKWCGIGMENIKRSGFSDNVQLLEKGSELALPELLANNQSYRFGFIDGWHTFDHCLMDFFYINKMLEVGGVICFDDAHC